MQVPYWPAVLALSRKVAAAVGLGYVGVDIVVDAAHGPMLLEANARPGLAIQMANGQGLSPRLAAIDRGEQAETLAMAARESADLPLAPSVRVGIAKAWRRSA